MKSSSPSCRDDQRGAVIVFFALLVLLILCFVALGVDGAKLMVTHTQLQNAAAAAALAGVSAIDMDTGAINPDTAIARAREAASRNRAFRDGSEPVTLLDGDVEFPAPRQVKVTARRTQAAGG